LVTFPVLKKNGVAEQTPAQDRAMAVTTAHGARRVIAVDALRMVSPIKLGEALFSTSCTPQSNTHAVAMSTLENKGLHAPALVQFVENVKRSDTAVVGPDRRQPRVAANCGLLAWAGELRPAKEQATSRDEQKTCRQHQRPDIERR
jgi:hypothetical protein